MRALTVVVAMLPGVAYAQTDGAQADALFKKGKQLLAEGKTAAACEAFDASQAKGPTVSTQLNQANCREKNGQLATALGLFIEAERQTRDATDKLNTQLHAVAVDKIKKLEPRVSRLTIAVAARVDGLVVSRDATVVESGAFDSPLPIDGGRYTISARAPGREPWSKQVTLEPEGEARTITIPELALAPAGRREPAKPQQPETTRGSRSRRAPILFGALALGSIAGAVVLDLNARSIYSDAEVEVDDAKQRSLWQSANTRRYVAEGLAVAGLTCAGLAIWLAARGGGSEAKTAQRVRVEPRVAIDFAGLQLSGAY